MARLKQTSGEGHACITRRRESHQTGEIRLITHTRVLKYYRLYMCVCRNLFWET
jgi:hypothetical protein